MDKQGKRWRVRDKRRLLAAMMEELAGNAHISFAGHRTALRLLDVPAASQDETP
jgi:hypothetical protein